MNPKNYDGDFTKSPLAAKMSNGENIKISTCTCFECGNEFFVRADSDDYIPNYCPYCGIKFIGGKQK